MSKTGAISTYDAFVAKWANRYLYSATGRGTGTDKPGRIEMYRVQSYEMPPVVKRATGFGKAVVDRWTLPRHYGWRDAAQRREFYRDAKEVGVVSNPEHRREFYKVIAWRGFEDNTSSK